MAANAAKPASQSAPTASAGAPEVAPTAASHFRDAMGQYMQQAPLLRLRYGACLFRFILMSPALISRDQFLFSNRRSKEEKLRVNINVKKLKKSLQKLIHNSLFFLCL